MSYALGLVGDKTIARDDAAHVAAALGEDPAMVDDVYAMQEATESRGLAISRGMRRWKTATVVFKADSKGEVVQFMKDSGMKHYTGGFTDTRKPAQYRCVHDSCFVEWRVMVTTGGGLHVVAPEGLALHEHEASSTPRLRRDSIFTVPFAARIDSYIEIGAQPSDIYNALLRSNDPALSLLIPDDLTLIQLQNYKRNKMLLYSPVRNINELRNFIELR